MTSSAPRPKLFPWQALACALAGAAVFQFFGNANRGYIDTASLFYWWGFQWANPGSETQHGWLILGLSVWLLWRNLSSADFSPAGRGDDLLDASATWPAVTSMIAGLALHALGFAAQQARFSIVALLLFTWGVLRLSGGRRWGAAAVFPLVFMVFAIPLDALDSLGFGLWLRMQVVSASTWIAHAVGIGVLRSGTQLVAPDGAYHYDVAGACSGIRSLTAMAALSLLAGYLNFHSWGRRALVLLLCFPFVYVGNVARIVAIIFSAQMGGPKWGDVAHEVMGYGVFGIVLGGVLAGISLLRRWWPENPTAECHPLDDAPVRHLMDDKRTWATAAGVMALAIGEIFFLRHIAQSPARGEVGVRLAPDGQNPVELPAFVGTEWIGRRAQVSAIEREILPPDTGFSRKTYVSLADPRQQVFLSIVLSGRDRTSIHRPELCLVGQGWTIVGNGPQTFRGPGAGKPPFEATLLRVRREVQGPRGKEIVPQLVAYWFVGGDCVTGTHWQRLITDAWNRVVHGRVDRWAYVLMQTDVRDGEAAGLARMQAVLDATLPAFQQVFAVQKP